MLISILKKIIPSVLGDSSQRTSNILNHINWSFLYKAGSVLSSFLIVSFAVSYLGNEDYGIWLTLSSILAWFMLFDLGLGNGLRNSLAKAIAIDDHKKGQELVSTAYIAISFICLLLLFILLVVTKFIDWTIVFNTSKDKTELFAKLIPMTIIFFCLQLISRLIVSIHLANQNHSMQTKVEFFGQLGSLLSILFLFTLDHKSLILFGLMYLLLPLIVLVVLNIISFNRGLKKYRPKLLHFKIKHLNEIAGLGIYFFIIQIAALILFTTDNIILTQLFGPSAVVPYNITFRYFSIISMLYGVAMIPFWSSFTDAYAKNDIKWIKSSIHKVVKVWLFTLFAMTFMVIISNHFFLLWVGDIVEFEFLLVLLMAISISITTFGMVFTYFINGVGKLKIQAIFSFVIIIFNIPLSIFFALSLDLGSSGVILGTILCQIITLIPILIQTKKIIDKTADGIWND